MNTEAVTDEQIERAHKALMAELFFYCQPDKGNVFAFMDDHPEFLRAALAAAAIPAAPRLRDALNAVETKLLNARQAGSLNADWHATLEMVSAALADTGGAADALMEAPPKQA